MSPISNPDSSSVPSVLSAVKKMELALLLNFKNVRLEWKVLCDDNNLPPQISLIFTPNFPIRAIRVIRG